MSSPTDNRQDRRGGFYWPKQAPFNEKVPFVSVTTVLSVVSKPALHYWFGKEVYRAMVVDPSLSEKEALAAPYMTSKGAMARGTTVHNIVENYVHNKEYVENTSDDFKPYAQALQNWVNDHGIEMISHEKSLLSQKFGYAGTLDLFCKLGQNKRNFIVDIKTGKDIYDDYFLQLSAYKQALKEQEGIDAETAILLLSTGADGKPTGKYKFQETDYCFDEFLNAKGLWEWKNADLIESVGYVRGVREA